MGRRLATRGFLVLFVGAVAYLFLSGQAQSSPLNLLSLGSVSLAAIGALMLLTGLGMNVAGRAMRRSAARFARSLTQRAPK
jgi:hypothetical protein